MLKLQNIGVELSSPSFKSNSAKYLRVSVGKIIKQTSMPAKFISETSIEWSESLTFPLLYNKQLNFEIYEEHEFGYNPQQFQKIMMGKLSVIDLSQSSGTWQIFNSMKQKIGFLSATIVSKNPSIIRNESRINNSNSSKVLSQEHSGEEQKVFRIVSMVARIPNSNLKKGFVSIEVGNQQIQTEPMKSRAGQLVFIDAKQIYLESSDTTAIVRVYTIQMNEQILVGEGTIQLIGSKPNKKVILMKEGFESGEIYVDSRIIDKSKASKIYLSHSKMFKTNQSQMPLEESLHAVKNSSKSIDFSRMTEFGIPHTNSRVNNPLDSSMISTLSSRKRISVMNRNNNIVFAKEKRFMMYQDKQNDRVSYLGNRSFEFRDAGTRNNYHGKSIGYGQKTDFTHGSVKTPGVGNYKLPSIWDRY